VVIPSFAVGRTQELLYFIREIKKEKMVKGHGEFKVFLDSPLAQEATGIFMQCDPDNFDLETRELIHLGINPLYFEGLNFSITSEDSKAINFDREPKVIISASGMCEAGRIRHHLKHNLWREECLILFAGYQSEGTLGRILLDQIRPTVKLFEEEIQIKAEIAALHNTSGHADKPGLTAWLAAFQEKPLRIFVNHGSDESCDEFTEYLKKDHGYNASAPYSGTIFDLISDDFILQTTGVRVEKSQSGSDQHRARDPRAVRVFNRLMEAVNHLMDVAKKSEGFSNRDLAKFADQVNELSKKWAD